MIRIVEFAKAMRRSDPEFAARVAAFEEEVGACGPDELAVLAQAAYYCAFQAEYRDDLAAVCRAIGSRKPVPFYLCTQVAPGRWLRLNSYVVALQQWLGDPRPAPAGIEQAWIDYVHALLGDVQERREAKTALVHLFLGQHIDQLLHRTSLTQMGGVDPQAGADYPDFTSWYVRPGGQLYAAGAHEAFELECKERARQAMRLHPGDAEELILRVLQPREDIQPPCMHRFTRYQDIKLASIGALKWRGADPPDTDARERWERFFEAAHAALSAWLEGKPVEGAVGRRLSAALGPPTPWSAAVVRDFLLAEKTGSPAFFYWLGAHSQDRTPRALFRGTPPGGEPA